MNPFKIGQVIPGYCCGMFPIDTLGQSLRVEFTAVDWMVVRSEAGMPYFWSEHNGTDIDGWVYLEAMIAMQKESDAAG